MKIRARFKVLLVLAMILCIFSNAFLVNGIILDIGKVKGDINGLLFLSEMTYYLIGNLYSKIRVPDFEKLLNGTVVIYKNKYMSAGVCIDEDDLYQYILTVSHMILRKPGASFKVIKIPESNISYIIKLDIIKKFLNDNSNILLNPKRFSSITVTFRDFTKVEAEVIKIDKTVDLALLRIPKQRNTRLEILKLSQIKPKIGDKVFIVGHSLGVYYNLTKGIISNLDDIIVMVVDAMTTFGNSGGGVFDTKGELIGISSQVAGYCKLVTQ